MIGEEMKVKTNADLPTVFHGMRVKVLRKSPRTGGLTVEVLEKCGCYRAGDELHVSQADLEAI